MDPAGWLQKALDELVELAPAAESDPADAWRTGVLLARLLGSPSGPLPPAQVVRRLPQVLAIAGPPDAREILDRVASELASDTDPWGQLLDALLDADDSVGVLTLSGESETAVALARRVAGLVSLFPERALELGAFAEMRLATVRETSCAGILWSAVERAPAHALAAALPSPVVARARLERTSEARRRPAAVASSMSFGFQQELLLAAAESQSEEVWELTTDGIGRAWVFAEGGRMRLELTGLTGTRWTVELVAEARSDGAELSRIGQELDVSGSTGYADLGPWAGPENALHRLVAGTGMQASQIRIRLVLALPDG